MPLQIGESEWSCAFALWVSIWSLSPILIMELFRQCDISFHFITIKYKLSTWVAQQVPLVKQDSITLPEHLRLALVFSGVCVTQSVVLGNNSLSFNTFSFVISSLTRFMDSGYLCRTYTSNYLIDGHHFLFFVNNGARMILQHSLK